MPFGWLAVCLDVCPSMVTASMPVWSLLIVTDDAGVHLHPTYQATDETEDDEPQYAARK